LIDNPLTSPYLANSQLYFSFSNPRQTKQSLLPVRET
jgi:hypothetical protein